jgi:hypothetical protein
LSSGQFVIGQKFIIPGAFIKNPNPNSAEFSVALDDDDKYHLVHKSMRQPRLMKLSRTNVNGNCLSSDVVSMAVPWLTS